MSDPADEVRAILNRYAKGEIGPPGADHEIMQISRKKGHIALKQIPPMQVGIHKLNQGGMIGTSKGVRTLLDKIAVLLKEIKTRCDHGGHAAAPCHITVV